MKMSNVISLESARKVREYQTRIQQMNKLELLQEMMNYHETRTKIGHLSPKLMVQGQILFKALEARAETGELRALAQSYHRHLKCELESFLKGRQSSA